MRGRLRATTGMYNKVDDYDDDDDDDDDNVIMSGYLRLQCLCGGVWGEMSRGPRLNSLSSLIFNKLPVIFSSIISL